MPDERTLPRRDVVSRASAAPTAADVSVVVVNWNTRDELRRCLASVFGETKDVSFEVFVVDNASADGSAEMVRREFPQVELIANADNRGFAAANNQALLRARGRYCLLLNPDTRVLDGAIDRCVRLADETPDVGALGCQVLEGEGAVQRTCFRFPSVFDEILTRTGLARALPGGGPTMKDWDRTTARDVDVVSGMFLLVRREAMDEVGLMDEAYFVYAEEADWCFRLRRAGWRNAFTPAARIVHEGGGGKSTAQVKVAMHVQLQKSMLVFHRKNRGLASYLALKAVYVATNAARAALFVPLAKLSASLEAADRARCATASLAYHVLGRAPRGRPA
jgi:GT2 family glycosyltransferase